MFCYVVGTNTKCIINDFAPAPRIDICIIQCHTVTHGTDLRKSPQKLNLRQEPRLKFLEPANHWRY